MEFLFVQIVDVDKSMSRTDGHSKIRLTGLDVFCASMHVEVYPSAYSVQVFEGGSRTRLASQMVAAHFIFSVVAVVHEEYIFISMSDDGYASLMDPESCALRSDLSLPPKELKLAGVDTNKQVILM